MTITEDDQVDFKYLDQELEKLENNYEYDEELIDKFDKNCHERLHKKLLEFTEINQSGKSKDNKKAGSKISDDMKQKI